MADFTSLPSLGIGGVFSPSSTQSSGGSFDFGGLLKDALGVGKSYFDSTASLANAQVSRQMTDQSLLTGTPLEQQLTANQANQNGSISPTVLILGGVGALVALVLVMKS